MNGPVTSPMISPEPMLTGFGSGSARGGRRSIGDAPDPPAGDPRLLAFRDLVEATDRNDIPATLAAMRELRRLGWSCCPTSNRPGA